jgi:hypothetical protein
MPPSSSSARRSSWNNRGAQYHYNLGWSAPRWAPDDVVTHNRRAVALEPDYADAHTNLASAPAPRVT